MHTPKPSRRQALTALGALPAFAGTGASQPKQAFAAHEHAIPIKGKAGPGMEPLDAAVTGILERHGVPGATLAIAKGGRLLYAKGFGWADTTTGTVVEPDTLFNLASLSKPLTAVAILKLAEQGKLKLDDNAFGLIPHVKPPKGTKVDARLQNITLRHCLYHAAGWDRSKTGDPVNWQPQICRFLKVPPPLTPAQFLSFMMTETLDFDPGTNAEYSNVGFILLGEVIATVAKQPYEKYVRDNVLTPVGIKTARVSPNSPKYAARAAHRHLAGTMQSLPPLQFPMIDASGGWIASAVDMLRFLTNLDGSRGECVLSAKSRAMMLEAPPAPVKPHETGTHWGLGWDSVYLNGKEFGYIKQGSYRASAPA